MKYSRIVFRNRRNARRSAVMGFATGAVLTALVFATATHALSVPPETTIQMHCDEQGLIEAHYAEVIDALRGERRWFVPGYDLPPMKPAVEVEVGVE